MQVRGELRRRVAARIVPVGDVRGESLRHEAIEAFVGRTRPTRRLGDGRYVVVDRALRHELGHVRAREIHALEGEGQARGGADAWLGLGERTKRPLVPDLQELRPQRSCGRLFFRKERDWDASGVVYGDVRAVRVLRGRRVLRRKDEAGMVVGHDERCARRQLRYDAPRLLGSPREEESMGDAALLAAARVVARALDRERVMPVARVRIVRSDRLVEQARQAELVRSLDRVRERGVVARAPVRLAPIEHVRRVLPLRRAVPDANTRIARVEGEPLATSSQAEPPRPLSSPPASGRRQSRSTGSRAQ